MPDNKTPFNGNGPLITKEEQSAIDNYYKNHSVPNYSVIVNPNNYKISSKSERQTWWENEGRNKFSERFSNLDIDKRGEFKDRKLERIYRNILFKNAFGHLKDYGNLKSLSPEDRDNFYTEWHGRTDKDIIEATKKRADEYSKKKDKSDYFKNQKYPHLLNRDTWEGSYNGREAAVIKGEIESELPIKTDTWSIDDRKKFYNDWYDKKTGWKSLNDAANRYPELFDKTNFSSQKELDDYFIMSFERIFNAGIGTGPKYMNPDTMSVNNPNTESIAKIQPVIFDTDVNRVQNTDRMLNISSQDIDRWTKQAMYDIEHQEETDEKDRQKKERIEKFKKDWEKNNPVHHFWLTGSEEQPFKSREKQATAYAYEQEMLYEMSDDDRREYNLLQKRLELFENEYKSLYAKLPFFGYRDNKPSLMGLAASENAPKIYALRRNAEFERQTFTIPQEQNPFANGITINNMPEIAANFSGIYQEFNGSNWMPKDEIPWDKIYERTKNLWESGHIAEAIFQMDRIIEDDVIAEHQKWFSGRDNLGHAGELEAAWKNFYSMGVESLVEGATFVPSLIVGFGQAAINPTELQTESGMSFFDRTLDDIIHNDWMGFASNQNVSDWASEIMENSPIYGYNIGESIMKGAGTAGAQVGNLLTFALGGLEAKAAKALMNDAAKATERILKKEIVNAGKLAQRNIWINKAVDNLNLFKANYGEAMQQALEGERQIYQEGESRKKELIRKYRPEREYLTVEGAEGMTTQTLIPFEAHFTEDELKEALNLQDNAQEWKNYFEAINRGEQAIPPQVGISVEEFIDNVRRDAEGLHRLYQEVPDYNDNIALNAKLKANIDLVTQTALLFGFDRLFGGLDKWTLDFVRGRRALKSKELAKNIKGLNIGNLKPKKQWIKGAWTVAKNPIIETITEVGQQSGSAITKQMAEHNINSFLENQLYGNGLQSFAATTYEGLYNLDKEEFGRDAQIKETILQTLLTTPLMPILGGYKGGRSKRGQNQSWISRAIENVQYFSPVKTTIGQQIYNIGQHNKQVQAAIDYINRWGADPNNQANTRGLIGVQNYTEKMIADLINNNEVEYNNDVFSRTLSEAIMLANTRDNAFAQNRLQWLTNMSQIKSASDEQKSAAIESMRQEAAGNSSVRNLSDEELLNLMESSSKKVLDAYNKVNEIIASDERFTDGTYDWQQQSALIFNKMAREDLQTRLADKENRIQAAIQSLGDIDLGESKTSTERVENNKVNNKRVLLSGRDILALSPAKRAAMLSPKNLNSYSPEQQKIIQETINALNQVDGNVLNDIRNAGLEEYYLIQIEKDYKASLQSPNWQSKRVKDKANKIKDAFNSKGNTKAFNNRLSNSSSVSDVYNAIIEEREANSTRNDDSVIDIDDILDNITNTSLKQKVEEAKKIERTSNSILSNIYSSDLSDDIKDNLASQVENITHTVNSASELTDISKYNIPILPDGQDLSGVINNILQTAAQNAGNIIVADGNPVGQIKDGDKIPKPTNLSDRDIDTGNPVNDGPIVRYTLEEAQRLIEKINELWPKVKDSDDATLVLLQGKINAMTDDLTAKIPEGYILVGIVDANGNIHNELRKKKSEGIDKKDGDEGNIDDIDKRGKEGGNKVVDRDGITKVAEIQFTEGGKVYTYPIRDEDVQLGDGINNTVGTETGMVINIRDVQDDTEAEFLIYQTDKDGKFKTDEQGNKIKRDKPQFINRHSQTQIQVNKQEQGKVVLNLDGVSRKGTPYTSRYIQTIDDNGFIHIKHEGAPAFKLKVKSSDLQSSLDDLIGKREDFQTEEGYNEILEDAQGKGLTIVQIIIRPDNTISIQTTNGITIEGGAAKEILNKYFYNQQSPTSSTENPPITGSTGGGRYSNRTEYQQSVVDNNVTPAVTELDGTALSKGLFEYNRATAQPNVMRQLQEEGAFDYVNRGALNEGDEIEFVVSQEQMPNGTTQVVIWEVSEPKDKREITNPKWHGKQLLNVLDQTEIGGSRKNLIDRIRKAYDNANRPESFLYTNEKIKVDKITHSIVPFRQLNPSIASSEETIENTNLKKGLTKQNGVWGISFFNRSKGSMVHVPMIFRQAKKLSNGSSKILFSDKRMESRTIKLQESAVGNTGEVNSVTMVVPTPSGFVSALPVYVLLRSESNIAKYKDSINNGSVGKGLIEKIKNHLSDIKTVSAFSDYIGLSRGFSEYIYNDRNHGRIDLGYRNLNGNVTLVSAILRGDKYILVNPNDAREVINDNNNTGFTLDEVCKEYLNRLIDNNEADFTMRLNMEAISNNPAIMTDLIDDGLLWSPNSLNARFTAANTQFNAPLISEPIIKPKEEPKQEPIRPKEAPKPAPVASNNNPTATITEVKKEKPKVDDNAVLGNKVKRRKLKAGQGYQIPQIPTNPNPVESNVGTNVVMQSSFDSLSEEDKQKVQSKVTKDEWNNMTKEEQDNILNC